MPPARMPFDPEVADEICLRLAKGESLRAITSPERDDFMPGMTTVFRWLEENAAFAKQYAHAREAQAEALFDDIVSIADGGEGSDPQRDRLRVDARKWVVAKLAPRRYGEKLALEHAGPGGGSVHVNHKLDLSHLDDDQLRLLAAIPLR